MDISLLRLLDYAAYWVFWCSLASLVLPPPEFFEEFPRFQKWYRFALKFLKYVGSLDFRARIVEKYPSFQRATMSGQEKSPFAK